MIDALASWVGVIVGLVTTAVAVWVAARPVTKPARLRRDEATWRTILETSHGPEARLAADLHRHTSMQILARHLAPGPPLGTRYMLTVGVLFALLGGVLAAALVVAGAGDGRVLAVEVVLVVVLAVSAFATTAGCDGLTAAADRRNLLWGRIARDQARLPVEIPDRPRRWLRLVQLGMAGTAVCTGLGVCVFSLVMSLFGASEYVLIVFGGAGLFLFGSSVAGSAWRALVTQQPDFHSEALRAQDPTQDRPATAGPAGVMVGAVVGAVVGAWAGRRR